VEDAHGHRDFFDGFGAAEGFFHKKE